MITIAIVIIFHGWLVLFFLSPQNNHQAVIAAPSMAVRLITAAMNNSFPVMPKATLPIKKTIISPLDSLHEVKIQEPPLHDSLAIEPVVPSESNEFLTHMDASYNVPATLEQVRSVIADNPKLNHSLDAVAQNLSGQLKVIIFLADDGGIQFIHLLQSSGNDTLDREAQDFIAKNWHLKVPETETQFRYLKLTINYQLVPQQVVLIQPDD